MIVLRCSDTLGLYLTQKRSTEHLLYTCRGPFVVKVNVYGHIETGSNVFQRLQTPSLSMLKRVDAVGHIERTLRKHI